MAATGRDVPLVQLTGRDRRRSGRGNGHGSIPAAGRSGRARHSVCGLGVRVDTWGSVGRPARRRDAETSGAGPVRAGSRRSDFAPARAKRPSRAGGVGRETGDGGTGLGPPAIGSCAIAFPFVPFVACPPLRLPPVSSPARAACQCFVRTFGRHGRRHGPGGGPPARTGLPGPPESTRRARDPAYPFAALLSQRRPSCHTCHGWAGLPSHPGTAPDRPPLHVVHPPQAW